MPKVLVADDSIAVRKVAERLLTEAGFGVTLAANGEEALAYLSKERPDVVVSDVIMPDKSGYEVCAFIRGNAMLAATPVLLISGIVNDEVTKQAESCHADGVLKKPFQGTSLKDHVLELLAKRQEPAPVAVPASAPAALAPSVDAGSEPRVTEEQLATYRQAVVSLKEVEAQLQVERTRSAEWTKRVADLDAKAGRMSELESMLETEQQRSAELTAQVSKGEQLFTQVQDLERALKAEQDLTAKLKQEGQGFQKALSKVAELDATLNAERVAAAQLVQQLTGLGKAAARAKEFETQLVREEHRASEFEQRATSAEAALVAERARVGELSSKLAEAERHRLHAAELESQLAVEQQKGTEIASRLNDMEQASVKLQEIGALLATERDRNGLLARRVSEAEQAADNATKRFEDMARKLGEIAGLASQLGNGKGRS